jgi:flagellar protein FliO/FliZ
MLGLVLRLIASLAVVVGLLLLLARLASRRFTGRAGAPIQVVHRQQLSRGSAVAVVAVGSRVLLVGTTDHQVSLLTELDPEELTDLDASPVEPADTAGDLDPAGGALTGSLLSARTWRQAFSAVASGSRRNSV